MSKYIVLGILLLLPAGPTAAADLTDLHVNGFISQGLINTSHNNYLVDDSKDGTFEYHEAALSFQSRLDDHMRVGLQFMARDFGETGNNNVLVDWAYGDYRWRDSLGVRIGKFKTPHGLYGQGRDIDILRPTVLLPQSVYNEAHRSFILGVQGASLYGNIALERGGSLDYEFYTGAMNIPDPTRGFWGDIFTQAGNETAWMMETGAADSTTYEFLGSAETATSFDMVYGGSLLWTSSSTRFRLGVSGMTTNFEMVGRQQFRMSDPSGTEYFETPFLYEGEIGRLFFLSGEYRGDRLGLAAEYYQEQINERASEGYYIQTSLQGGERFTWTYTFARFLRDRDDYGGANMVALGFPDFTAWQNDYSLGGRYDATENLILKLEYHRINGMGLLSPAKNDPDDPDAYKRWWSFFTAKATIHF